jgi:hypothetical protein
MNTPARELLDDICEGNMGPALDSFNERFPGSDINQLSYLGEFFTNHFFLLGDKSTIACLTTEDRPHFYMIERFKLSSKGATCFQNDEEFTHKICWIDGREEYRKPSVSITKDDGVITYELYPIEQGLEFSLDILLNLHSVDKDDVEELQEPDDPDAGTFLCQVDDSTSIHRGDTSYEVHRNGEVISAFEAPEFMGQGYTKCYLVKSNNMVIIDNLERDEASYVIVNLSSVVLL